MDAYIRVSQRAGRSGERYISPAEQRRVIEGFGLPIGLEVVEEDVSGALPADKRRLGELLARCERGESDGIIVSAVDRLTRGSKLVEAEIFERMNRAGARFVAVTDGIDTGRGGEEAEFTLDLLAAVARREWKRYRRTWAAARRRAIMERGQHLCAHVPVGYRRDAVGTKPNGRPAYGPLYPDPELAPVVRELFRRRAAGASWGECRRLFEEAGVPNRRGEQGWSHRGLQNLIKSRAYLGWAFHGEDVNREAHPAIVDPDTWEAAQPAEGSNVRRPSDGALLAGVLACACCGDPLQYERGRSRYRCRRYRGAGPLCEHPASVRADEIEPLVERAFVATTPLYLLPPEETPDTRPLQQELTEARAQYEAWLRADISDIDPEAFRRGVETRKARLDVADEALRRAQTEGEHAAERLMLIQRWERLGTPEKRRWLKEFGVTVQVRRGREPAIERVTMMREREPLDPAAVDGMAGVAA